MTDKETLTKAIQKAIDGGWKTGVLGIKDLGQDFVSAEAHNLLFEYGRLEATFFNHDFAKALWGDYTNDVNYPQYSWQYHLQNMVISDDPIAYLGANI